LSYTPDLTGRYKKWPPRAGGRVEIEPIDRDYMAPPSRAALVTLDPALLVIPPKGLEVGYVPLLPVRKMQVNNVKPAKRR